MTPIDVGMASGGGGGGGRGVGASGGEEAVVPRRIAALHGHRSTASTIPIT